MAQIAFQTMPKAVGADAADMPHILGDPADVAWQGVAERSSANFAAFNTWAPVLSPPCHASVEATGAAVFVAAAPDFTLSWAVARTVPMAGGIKLACLDMRFAISTDAFIGTSTGDAIDRLCGTIAAAYRFNLGAYLGMTAVGGYFDSGGLYTTCSCRVASNGTVTLDKLGTRYDVGTGSFFLHMMYPLGTSP